MLKDIKAIFLDADDTIINHKECEKQALVYLFDNIEREYKNEYQDIFRPLDKRLWEEVSQGKNQISKKDIPEYRFKLFFEKINLDYTNYEIANRLFQEGLSKSSALIEGAEDVIKYLYQKGYKLYVVTNGLVKLQKPRIINTGIGKFISDIIVSEEIGVSKPDPQIFRILLERIKLKSEEVIMIGDSIKKDLKGAKDIGIRTIWYNPDNEINDTNIIPNYKIGDLEDLKNMF